MEVIARSKYVSMSAQKLRLVADLIRGSKVEEAKNILPNLHRKAARLLLLVLKQAIGNATNNFHLEEEKLKIKKLEIKEGPRLKRGQPVSRGRWHPILKRTSHIEMVLEGEAKKGLKNGA